MPVRPIKDAAPVAHRRADKADRQEQAARPVEARPPAEAARQ